MTRLAELTLVLGMVLAGCSSLAVDGRSIDGTSLLTVLTNNDHMFLRAGELRISGAAGEIVLVAR